MKSANIGQSTSIVVLLSLVLGIMAEATQKVLSGGGKQKKNPLDSKFEEVANRMLEKWHVPGIAIAVVDGDETWAAGYGYATLPSTPVTPDTLFYTGSTTKAFTAAAFSQLIDDDKNNSSSPETAPSSSPLGWRTPISQLIRDDFVLLPEYSWAQEHLTVEDALSHRTGFPRHDKSFPSHSGSGDERHPTTVRDLTRSLRYLSMVHEPRVEYRYCNLMFMVISHVIETLTGGTWIGDVLRERIWAPLGMNSTHLSLESAVAAPEDLATGYYWNYNRGSNKKKSNDGGGGGFVDVPFLGLREASGAGGIISNVRDYAKWTRCLMDETAPLSSAGHKAIKTPRTTPAGTGAGYDGPATSYALGWKVNTYRGQPVYSHGGGMLANGADVWFFPGLRFGVVAMGNTAFTSNALNAVLAWRLIRDRLRIPEEERFDWNALYERALEFTWKKRETAVQDLYPNRPDPPLAPALSLADYTGTYHHPGYHNMTLEFVDDNDQEESTKGDNSRHGRLVARRDDFVWPMRYDFAHVSGEFWIVYIDMKDSPNLLSGGQLAKAEFRLGPDGKVAQVVVEFREDGSEGLVTFTKIA